MTTFDRHLLSASAKVLHTAMLSQMNEAMKFTILAEQLCLHWLVRAIDLNMIVRASKPALIIISLHNVIHFLT